MNVSSKPLKISPDQLVDPITRQAIRIIDSTLRGAQVPNMLVDATARDLLLHHVYGHAVTRLTYDVDFAILVDSWDRFASVKQLLLNIPGFTDKGNEKQRLYYLSENSAFENIIDIIPFGKLETALSAIPGGSSLPS